MNFKTIYLIILAIFFLGIVIYDLFVRTNSFKEGFNPTNSNVRAATVYLYNRKQKDNPNGATDTIILEKISRLGSYGDEKLNTDIGAILKNTNPDTEKVKVDKLSEIFGVPSYDPLNDSLVIYYNFKEMDTTDITQPVIRNESLNNYNDKDPDTFDAKVIFGVTTQTKIGDILNSETPIINNSHLKLTGGYGQNSGSKNGAYLLLNNSPTFHNNGSFLGFSVSVWVNTNTNTGFASRIFDFGNGQGVDNIFISNNFWEYPGISFFVLVNGQWVYTGLRTNILNNKWVHIVWTISATDGEWKIYINNEILCEKEKYGIPSNVNRRICYIGKSHWWWDGLYNGKMADFRMYQREISAEDVNTLYNKGNVKANGLPELKGVNLIKNGSFSYPKINSIFGGVTPTNWNVTRQALIWNIPNNNFSGSGLYPSIGYANQLAILSNFGTNFTPGNIYQDKITVTPNVTYEFSFAYVLYDHPNSNKNNVYLTVKLGCYVDTGTDKSIVPKDKGQWQKYSITFTTLPDCVQEKLRITINSPKEGVSETSCGITCVSLRKLYDVPVESKPASSPYA